MYRNHALLGFFCVLLFACSSSNSLVEPLRFYVDSEMGNDEANGTSPSEAWRSLARVNLMPLTPGCEILFKAGGQWTGQLAPKGSGTFQRPIVIDRYGEGANPKINGAGVAATVVLHNQQYWEINRLEITNYDASEEEGITLEEWEAKNISDYAHAELPEKAIRNNSAKLGILITAEDHGAVRHIHLKNVVVHGVNGTIVPDGADENGESKHNGGIGFVITGSGKPTWFEDILVEGCVIRDVDRTGLFTKSSWMNRTFEQNITWTPSKDIVIRKNTFLRTGANALIVRVAHRPVMEHNLFDYCAIKGSGNAAFSFNTDGAVWQFNECRFTKANVGDNDAGGLDSDYRSKNTLIQYNWLHDNDFGMLVTGGGGNFNDGTVVRYNLIERDGRKMHRDDQKKFAIKVSGGATRTLIYNNTVYVAPDQDSTFLVFHKRWKVWPAYTSYYNNLFINMDPHAAVSLGESTLNTFETNAVSGIAVPVLNNLTGIDYEVRIVGVGKDGYHIFPTKAFFGRGKAVLDHGGRDFLGNPVDAQGIGAF